MNNALLYIGGLLVLALTALFAVPYFVDWNSYRGVFEEEATRVLGRDVRVGGDVNLRLLPAPYVSFEKLKIAEMADDGGESFFRAESFTMWLSVPPLLKGVLEAKKVELRRPVLKLVANADGGGNWQSLAVTPGLMPFVPKDVALQSVSLIDGAVALGSAGQGELARIEGINGELAAETLYGPYRFSGRLTWEGKPREVRFSTAEQGAGGDIRFKSSVRALDTGNSYVLAGSVSDIKGRPRIEGDLSSLVRLRLAVPEDEAADEPDGTQEDAAAPAAAVAPETTTGPAPDVMADVPERPALLPEKAAMGPPPFELRAKLKGDVTGVGLDDINLSLVHDGPPQLIAGTARLGWHDKMRLDVSLDSRWLDLDRIAGSGEGEVVPLEAARGFFEALLQNLPETADTNASLTLDQVTLGGEVLSGLRLAAHRSGGPLELKSFRAGLPGGARFDLENAVIGGVKKRSIDGMLNISGPSLSRFLDWALKQRQVVEARAEGSFALEGRLKLSEKLIELQEATAELAGMPLAGSVRLALGKRRKLRLSVEGHRIDVGNLWPGSLDPERIRAFINDGTRAGADAQSVKDEKAPAGQGPWLSAANADLNLRLRAAELVDGERRLREVDADIAINQGALSMPVLKLTTAGGLVVDLEGEATDVAGNPKGALRGTVAAKTAEAIGTLSELAGLAETAEAGAGRFSGLAPMRVAGVLELGKRSATAADLRFDGEAAGGRIIGHARLDAGWNAWSTAPADITLNVDGRDTARVVEGLLSGVRAAPATTVSGEAAGRFVLRASGVAKEGLLSVVALDTGTKSAEFNGRLYHGAESGQRAVGDVLVRRADVNALLATMGVDVGSAADAPVKGTAGIKVDAKAVEMTPRSLTIGGSHVGGRLLISHAEGEGPTVTADLNVESATVPGLLRVMLDAPQPAPVAEPEQDDEAATGKKARRAAEPPAVEAQADDAPWPEEAFTEGFFKSLRGTAHVRFGTLSLEPGLPIHDAELSASLAPGRLDVTALTGRALGGRTHAAFAIERAAAGATLSGKVAIDVASKELAPDAPPDTKGDVASFRLDMAGRALGPLALVTSLRGEGSLTVGDVTLSGNTPKAVAEVAEAALQGTGANSGDGLAEALKGALKTGSLPLGAITVPVSLADGNLKLDAVKVETQDGVSSIRSVVELTSLRIDSEWQIEPKVTRSAPLPAASATAPADAAAAAAAPPAQAQPEERVVLPALTVSYTGKLRDFGSLEPIIATAALERELSVRKMERDVDQLERLRRQDQERAKADLERQKALEAERARAWEAQQAPIDEGEEDPTATGAEGAPGENPGADGAALPSDGAAAANAAADPAAATAEPPRPAYRRAKKKEPDNVWKPFQIQQF